MLRTTNVDEYNSREEYLREPRANWIIGWKFTESKKDPSGDALRRERERERERALRYTIHRTLSAVQ